MPVTVMKLAPIKETMPRRSIHTTTHIADVSGHVLLALSPEEGARADRHVEVCLPCQQLLRAAQELVSLLAHVVRPIQPPRRCKERLMERIQQ
jgi:hypothetical protein